MIRPQPFGQFVTFTHLGANLAGGRRLRLPGVAGVVFLLLLLLGLGPRQAVSADWPMYRGDAARTARVAEPLQLPLAPLWTHVDAHPPQPAWPDSRRMQFDLAMQPVSLGGRVVMGSSVDGTVFALDAHTGEVVWRFFTAGPIRFAPALWRDRAFVASDDGHLYALRLSDGALLWQHRGGPGDACVLGNQRMISKWPMRGGPAVLDGIVYCAAGIWPSDGIYLYALNAETGAVVWQNSDSGAIVMPQPHGGANAKSGVAAQGYLAVAGERLFVPTGRAVPASFDRRTGELEYFHLQKYGHNGESLAMVIDDVLFNGGVGFDVSGGLSLSKLGGGQLAASSAGVARAFDNKLAEYRWTVEEKPDRKGKPTKVRTLTPVWSAEEIDDCAAIITAGQQIVMGGKNAVFVFDAKSKKVVWQATVNGVAYGLAVANGRLLVSTDQGAVYCFAGPDVELDGATLATDVDRPAKWDADLARVAEDIVQKTQVTRGFCLDMGCGDGSLARELALRTELQVIAIDSDPEKVRAAARKSTCRRTAGLASDRVAAGSGDQRTAHLLC